MDNDVRNNIRSILNEWRSGYRKTESDLEKLEKLYRNQRITENQYNFQKKMLEGLLVVLKAKADGDIERVIGRDVDVDEGDIDNNQTTIDEIVDAIIDGEHDR